MSVYQEVALEVGTELGLKWAVLAVLAMATDPSFPETAVEVRQLAEWTGGNDRSVRNVLSRLQRDLLASSAATEVEAEMGTPVRKLWSITENGVAMLRSIGKSMLRATGAAKDSAAPVAQIKERLCGECGHGFADHDGTGCTFMLDDFRMCTCERVLGEEGLCETE